MANKTFYLDFNDLDVDKKEEITEEVEQWIEQQLKLEACGKQAMDFTLELKTWGEIINDLYDFETDQDRQNFIMEKAQDIITTAFRKIPVSLDLEFK